MKKFKIAIIMGSKSDAPVMSPAIKVLDQFGIDHEFMVVSAHRSPDWLYEYARTLEKKNIKIVIAGAGGAAHLPGMMAALSTVPVIGVPVKSANSIEGIDSLLSIVQMPNDIPVATVAINAAHNAAILAVQMLAIHDNVLKKKLNTLKANNLKKVDQQNKELAKEFLGQRQPD